jgi:hypothetical protein
MPEDNESFSGRSPCVIAEPHPNTFGLGIFRDDRSQYAFFGGCLPAYRRRSTVNVGRPNGKLARQFYLQRLPGFACGWKQPSHFRSLRHYPNGWPKTANKPEEEKVSQNWSSGLQ